MLAFIRSCPRARVAALFALVCFSSSCDGGDGDASDDPLADAQVVHCDLSEDEACLEYRRVKTGKTVAFVALDEARAVCAAGWAGDGMKPGTFAEGECPSAAALARCSIARGYEERDYFYEGFADTASLDDPLAPLTTLCNKASGTLETPPF